MLYTQKNPDHIIRWYILVVIFSLISTLALVMDRSIMPIINSFGLKSMLHLAIFAMVFYLSYHALKVAERRIRVASLVFGITLALIEIVGFAYNTYDSASSLWCTGDQIIKTMIALVGFSYLFYCFLAMAFTVVNNQTAIRRLGNNNPVRGGYLFYWGIIFLCWIPYWLVFFPGVINVDANHEIMQIVGISSWSDHHPIPYTLLIKLCFLICAPFPFFGNIAPLAAYTLGQMLVMSASFALAVWYLKQHKLPSIFVYLAFGYFALCPITAMYSITMGKDSLFACSVFVLTICLFDIIQGKDAILPKKLNAVLFCTAAVIIALFRHNGTYAVLMLLPILVLFMKRRRKLMMILFSCILVFAVAKGPIYRSLSIDLGSVAESLSVPIQQVARIVNNHGDELSAEDLQTFNNLFLEKRPTDDPYTPRRSDAVKNRFIQEYFNENRSQVIRMWTKLGLQYPREYISSFINGSFGYWYPGATYWITETEFNTYGFEAGRVSLLPSLLNFVDSYTSRKSQIQVIPVISMLFSIGFSFILFLFSGIVFILKHKARIIFTMLPAFLVWITCLFSPVYAEFRYILGMVLVIPFLLPIAICMSDTETAIKGD